ncbi:MAG: 5'-methylthioadenosine/S-adenosylhomocysteine nucleosidase family protein [Polyangia bacterium]
MSTLIVAAYPPELGTISGRAVGVGLVAAAAGTERALAEARPSRLILVGTAGALPGSRLTIGSIVVVARAQLIVRPGEYVPAILSSIAEADEALAAECARRLGAPLVTAASGIGITSSDEEATRLGATAQVEHLESFAVLSVAWQRVPATAVLAIANGVGSRAQAEWRANRVAAEAAAMAAVAKLVD